jgi:hypothetical protein
VHVGPERTGGVERVPLLELLVDDIVSDLFELVGGLRPGSPVWSTAPASAPVLLA